MAHLCMTKEHELMVLPLGRSGSVEVRADKGGYTFHSAPVNAGKLSADGFLLVPWDESGKPCWALVCSRGTEACVNGSPAIAGLQVLSDRDAVTMGKRSSPVFFLDEDPVRIEPFPRARDTVKCRRCRTPITEGQPSVRCPGCGQWYHQETGGRECWTYKGAKHCMQCKHPTSLDGTFSWTPEGL